MPVAHMKSTHRLAGALVLGGLIAAIGATPAHPEIPLTGPVAIDAGGWRVPLGAADERNPVAVSGEVLARGERTYRARCQRCHGPAGRGDGPEADPDRRPGDLSDPVRAVRNPDGVAFYKIWNGRRRPDMPAFSSQLSREEVWELVHFIKTLRRGGTEERGHGAVVAGRPSRVPGQVSERTRAGCCCGSGRESRRPASAAYER